jgi:hypothetical protein
MAVVRTILEFILGQVINGSDSRKSEASRLSSYSGFGGLYSSVSDNFVTNFTRSII